MNKLLTLHAFMPEHANENIRILFYLLEIRKRLGKSYGKLLPNLQIDVKVNKVINSRC